MRAHIIQIVDGVRYNTETAEIVASNEYWDGNNYERSGRNSHLYKSKNGRFFLGRSSQWQGENDIIEPVSKENAMEEYENLREKEMEYETTFGVEPTEA